MPFPTFTLALDFQVAKSQKMANFDLELVWVVAEENLVKTFRTGDLFVT